MYGSGLSDAACAIVEPQLPRALPGGRPRRTDLRAVVNAIFYLLRTGCQWRPLPRDYPPRSTVYHYFSAWRARGIWRQLQWELHKRARVTAGRAAYPTVVIMDGQSVKTTERGGTRGFGGHKRVRERKRHILVDTLGLPITSSGRADEHLGPQGRIAATRRLALCTPKHSNRDR
jgi:putative transposase